MTIFTGPVSPYDKAVANFKCALSIDRLKATPQAELDLLKTRPPRGSTSGVSSVYVIGNDANGLVKIGYADNLRNRFSGLNCGSPVCLRVLHFVHVVDGCIAKRVEGLVHKRLADKRRKGEWFEVSVAEAAAAIGEVLLENKYRWWTEEESWRLAKFAQDAFDRYYENKRFYGT